MTNRDIAPEIVIPTELKVKQESRYTTAKGVDIYSLQFTEYDVVRVSFVFKAGTKYQNTPFCATSVSGMLAEGCSGSSAREIAEILDFYGIYYDHSTDRDYSVITVCSLKRFFDITIELIGRMLSTPLFQNNEFDVYRNKRKQSIAIQRSKIDFIAREEFAKAMFGTNHHYGRSYKEESMDNLTVEELRSFHQSYYTCSNLFVVASGDIEEEDIKKIGDVADLLPIGSFTPHCGSEIVSQQATFVPWDDATQSVIRLGRILFTRDHPDFVATQVAATVLGGYFGSRLSSNLREDKGYTYGIFAGVINLEESGYIAISTEVESSITEDALNEIYIEIERLSNELVPLEELDIVKRVMAGEMMRILDGPFGIADITIENILTGRSNSYLNSHLQEIMSTTPERIMEISRKYFKKEDFITLIAGTENDN